MYFLNLKNSTECKNILGPVERQGITYLLLKRTEEYNSCKSKKQKNNNTLKNKKYVYTCFFVKDECSKCVAPAV